MTSDKEAEGALAIAWEQWQDKCARIERHGGRVAPGGVAFFSPESLYQSLLLEFQASIAKAADMPPSFVQIAAPPIADFLTGSMPQVDFAIPGAWLAAKGVRAAADAEVRRMLDQSLRGIVTATTERLVFRAERCFRAFGFKTPSAPSAIAPGH